MVGLSKARAVAALAGGYPLYLTIDGVLMRLLLGSNGAPLIGADGKVLYGRIS